MLAALKETFRHGKSGLGYLHLGQEHCPPPCTSADSQEGATRTAISSDRCALVPLLSILQELALEGPLLID